MRTVRLLTRSGEFVTEVEVPAFILPPDVIQWGSRHFLHITAEEYSEGLLYAIPDDEKGKKKK